MVFVKRLEIKLVDFLYYFQSRCYLVIVFRRMQANYVKPNISRSTFSAWLHERNQAWQVFLSLCSVLLIELLLFPCFSAAEQQLTSECMMINATH